MKLDNDSVMHVSPARGFGRAARAALQVAGICWLAACAPEDAPEDTADSETAMPYQFAEAEIGPVAGSGIAGVVRFDQNDEFLEIEGRVTGLTAGVYGVRVHEAGDCAAVSANTAGPLFSAGQDSPDLALDPDLPNEPGNLGDIVAGETGTTTFEFVDTQVSLGSGERSIVGHTFVIHAAQEGVGEDGLPALAGRPVACGEIELILAPTYVP